jgi:hypothetical protein
MPVRLGVLRAAALRAAFAAALAVPLALSLAASVVLTLVAGAAAQSPPQPAATAPQPKPVTGFVPTFEIMRTVRAAGFDPLAPPLRDGTAYVLRATDYRGIPMRVVLDARTGAIRDVTRIVPAASGSLGVVLPPYGPPPYEAPQEVPVESEVYPPALQRPKESVAPQLPQPIAAPPVTHAKASRRKLPLPRPRPAALATPHPPVPSEKMEENGSPAPAAASEKTSGNASPIIARPAPSPPAAQAKSPAAIPLND